MSKIVKKEKPQPIHVYLRIRPTNAAEKEAHLLNCVHINNDREITVKQQHGKKYCFEKVFGQTSKQLDVYKDVVKPLVKEVLSGYNCTVFAYGQTGTGKTYTMAGGSINSQETSWNSDEDAGVIPRALAHLFEELHLQQNQEFTVRVSYVELYNEEIHDLLTDVDNSSQRIRIYDDQRQKGAIVINGVEELTVCTKSEVYKILEKGQEKRRTASTLMNAQSSRSHTVFCITVYAREITVEGEEVVKMGKLNLVDLAGSENISRSGSVDIRAREAGSINQSLLTLGRCIKALVERSAHVPFRESKLTRILQDSLGGRTKTSIIATISPTYADLEETISTLEYAYRARNITNRPEVNLRFSKKALICQYAEEIERLQKDLSAAHSKTGIYLAPENYERLLNSNEYQKEEITEKIKIIRELETKIQLVENEKAMKEKEWDELNASFKKVEEYLSESKKNEKTIISQAKVLLNVVEQSTTNESKLHDKVDEFYKVTNKNQEYTNKVLYILDESLQNINRQIENFSDNYDSRATSLLNLNENSKHFLKQNCIVLNGFYEKEHNLENIRSELYEKLDCMANLIQKDIFNSAVTSKDSIEKLRITLAETTLEIIKNSELLKAGMTEQKKQSKIFTTSLTKKIENFREQLLNSSKVIEKKNRQIKETVINLINDMESDKEIEDKMLENYMVYKRSRYLKNSERFEKIVSSLNSLDNDIEDHAKLVNTNVNEFEMIQDEQQTKIETCSKNNFDTLETLSNYSAMKDGIVNEFSNVENTIDKDVNYLDKNISLLKNNFNPKFEEFASITSNFNENLSDLQKSIENLNLNNSKIESELNQLSEQVNNSNFDTKQLVKSCGDKVQKVLTEEITIVKPTGRTPVRIQFQYPKSLFQSSPYDRSLHEIEENTGQIIEKSSSSKNTQSEKANDNYLYDKVEEKENIV